MLSRSFNILRGKPWGFSLVPVRTYQVSRNDESLKTEYDDITNYGSYKNTIFTHRLPESTAQQSPPLVALHFRLNLPKTYQFSTLSQALNMIKYEGLANNYGLNTLGKTLLSYYVSEYLLVRYPRLPMPIHNAAVDSLMGVESLYELGKAWGIQVDTTSKLDKKLSLESEFLQYGRLRFLSDQDKNQFTEEGIIELNLQEARTLNPNTNHFISREHDAYASAVRSIIGGLYTHCGETVTKKFIDDHILSRKLLLENMFQFSQPTRELARLCEKLNFKEPLQIRLMAETGRLSSHAIYVAGVFVGTEKLGEGVGSSLNEAKTRAVVNSLMSYYLYTPINEEGNPVKLPSDTDYKLEGIIGDGDVAI
ncbi:54S ribosomal protein L3 mitochondrial [Yamadazyma tenuis]|uniref:Large ribosomal subunit protein mL44 n=1 Tax=Candida tenuis (strain ATCC 10573 / BCRC 21748 / CBS 615 / JCM 9827 / NBRC 10315 / NRRL Y-1498 / VKM Y-70) TaxID=590646 RepID=G3BE24_CANTC|nr:ribonuclease III [Yamadazyma tenuis ATCC 10573]XP_006690359.1 uncharacterized protein CANTEDRAFT_116476 [Yamadazyma tenuis ATCC 10573]EGV61144.1 ribonuclease III [Yamadazyma tenuis ATCC 10573]EGV61145.1 hypothetical protein CANTEDRAFT_116476 [Yamadazyma tenuis ATCC 10573]WEJ94316.1 54S ribosomal protein L3 mitochondrial [Yamadazyma tenuis]